MDLKPSIFQNLEYNLALYWRDFGIGLNLELHQPNAGFPLNHPTCAIRVLLEFYINSPKSINHFKILNNLPIFIVNMTNYGLSRTSSNAGLMEKVGRTIARRTHIMPQFIISHFLKSNSLYIRKIVYVWQ
jgi:hypothetical protein